MSATRYQFIAIAGQTQVKVVRNGKVVQYLANAAAAAMYLRVKEYTNATWETR